MNLYLFAGSMIDMFLMAWLFARIRQNGYSINARSMENFFTDMGFGGFFGIVFILLAGQALEAFVVYGFMYLLCKIGSAILFIMAFFAGVIIATLFIGLLIYLLEPHISKLFRKIGTLLMRKSNGNEFADK